MIFAILFVLAFLIGLVVYLYSDKWLVAVLVSIGLFLATTLADTSASESWGITLVFGLPIVFVASLFGAYVVELRRGNNEPMQEGYSDDYSQDANSQNTDVSDLVDRRE